MSASIIRPANIQELEHLVDSSPAAAIYFTTPGCSVCHHLLPKVADLFATDFPLVTFVHVALDALPEASGTYSVFTAPTLLVFFEGKETLRKIQNMGLQEVHSQVIRPYNLFLS